MPRRRVVRSDGAAADPVTGTDETAEERWITGFALPARATPQHLRSPSAYPVTGQESAQQALLWPLKPDNCCAARPAR